MRKPLIVGIVMFSLIVGLFVVGAAYQKGANKPTHQLTISYDTASGLVPGSDVFEAGAKIGSISGIEPDGPRALVTIQVADEYWPLHDGLQAGIRPKSLLGEKYVDLHDGTSNLALDTSKTVQAPANSTPVELDQFINSLDPTTRSAARILLNDVGAGLAGRGLDLNKALEAGRANLDHLAVTGQTLNNRDADLDRIILGLDGLLQKISTNDQLTQMSQLISNGQQTLNAIEAERVAWSRSFNDSAAVLAELNTAFDSAVPNVRDLLNIAPHLLSSLTQEGDLLAFMGSQVTQGNLLGILETGISHGPTASGGALEIYKDGRKLPIFRVCLPTGDANTNCLGNGFTQPQGNAPVPSSANGSSGSNSSALTAFAGMLGA
jgi:phospholipid/cholesterol/gamma-HCH transport system substrate-binding protein